MTPETAEAIAMLREQKEMKLATAREGARALVEALAVDEPDVALVEGAALDILAAIGGRNGLEDAIDVLEDEG